MFLGYGLRPSKKPKSPKMGLREGGPMRSDKHLRHVRTLHCVDPICERRDIQAAHVRAGLPAGEQGGVSVKPADYWAVPMCVSHHEEQHRIGERSFEQKYLPPNVTLAEWAIKVICPGSPDPRVVARAAELRRKL